MSLNEELRQRLRDYKQNPIAFCYDVFDVHLDKWQQDALNNMRDYQKLAIAGCTGVGKDFLAACIIWWFLTTNEYPKVICTAVKQETLKDNLWAELSKLQRRSPLIQQLFNYGVEKISLKGAAEEWFAVARTTSKRYSAGGGNAQSEGLAGKYADDTLAVIDEACHDSETEVLTERGWMYFKDLPKYSPRVLSMDPKTGIAEYCKYTDYIELPFDGELYTYSKRGGNFAVTPNHRFIYTTPQPWKPEKKSQFKINKIKDVSSEKMMVPRTFTWKGEERSEFHLDGSAGLSARDVNMDDWLCFLGWYLSEGSIRNDSKGVSGFTITQVKKSNHKEIGDLLTRLKFSWRLYKDRDFIVYDKVVANYLVTLGRISIDKEIPEFIGQLSPRQIRIFLDAFQMGDGYIHGKRKKIYTSSLKIANELQILIGKAGSFATINKRSIAGQVKYIGDHYATTSVDGYVVCESSNPESSMCVRRSDLEKVKYKGNVYCLNVPPNHLLYTRRNNYCMWSMNSGVDAANFDALEGSANTPRRKILVIGNPLRRSGRFAQIFLDHRFGKDWKTMHVSYLDSTRTSGPEEAKIRERWIEMYGIQSAYVQARVFGQFPSAATVDTVFTREELQEAVDRNHDLEDDTSLPLCIGIDCARFGDDETVYYVRRGLKTLDLVYEGQTSGPHVEGRAIQLAYKYTPKGKDPMEVTEFRIDETGLGGHGAVDHLREQGWKVAGVHNGSKTLMEEDYANLGAELWMEDGKEAIAECGLFNDEILLGQLETRRYTFTGRMKQRRLSTKDEMKREGMGSPDRADAFILAFAKASKLDIGPANLGSTICFL